ncbi:MAG: exosortase C-terminal domain/associated protein EpsI [Candidatus Rokuibacteriota bacterium]
MRTGRRLAVVLGLLAVTAGVVHVTPSVRECASPPALDALPAALIGWTGVDGIPDGLLPVDARATAASRRTYRSGRRVAWVSVALFTRQDEPDQRASVNRIYPQKDVSMVERVALPGIAAVIVSAPNRRFVVAYWHQIGGQMYASQSGFRLALMRDVLFARRGDSLLVRIAVPVGPEGDPAALTTAAELTRALEDALAGRVGC